MKKRFRILGAARSVRLLGVMCLLSVAGCASRHAPLETRVEGVTNGFIGGSLLEQMASDHVPGVSIAVIDGFEIEWARGFGIKSAVDGSPVDASTIFQASSISKAITAAIALKLVEDGTLDLDRSVNDRLVSWKIPENEFTARSPVTLRQLLSHTSGLNRPEGGFSHEGRYPTTVEILDGTPPATNRAAEVECVPGTELRYSNFGYIVVQQLIEDVTGESFADLTQRLILQPIGMASSTFRQPLTDELLGRAAFPHNIDGAIMERSFNPRAVAQGGLWTTPSDLARFLVEVMKASRGKPSTAMSPELAALMLRPPYPQLQGGRFVGLGFLVLGDWAILQAGADPGFRCLMAGFPKSGQGIVVMLTGEGGELLQLRLLLNFIAEYLLKPVCGWLVVGGVSLLLLISSFIVWPAGYLIGRIRRADSGRPLTPEQKSFCRRGRLIALLAATLILAAVYPYVLGCLSPSPPMGGSLAQPILVIVLLCATGLSFLVSVAAVQSWRRGFFAFPARIYFTAVSAAALVGSLLWLDLLGLF